MAKECSVCKEWESFYQSESSAIDGRRTGQARSMTLSWAIEKLTVDSDASFYISSISQLDPCAPHIPRPVISRTFGMGTASSIYNIQDRFLFPSCGAGAHLCQRHQVTIRVVTFGRALARILARKHARTHSHAQARTRARARTADNYRRCELCGGRKSSPESASATAAAAAAIGCPRARLRGLPEPAHGGRTEAHGSAFARARSRRHRRRDRATPEPARYVLNRAIWAGFPQAGARECPRQTLLPPCEAASVSQRAFSHPRQAGPKPRAGGRAGGRAAAAHSSCRRISDAAPGREGGDGLFRAAPPPTPATASAA